MIKSKTLEKMAKGIQDSCEKKLVQIRIGYKYRGWDSLDSTEKAILIGYAQIALDAAGILILPHDAEPMVGDTIEYEKYHGKEWGITYYDDRGNDILWVAGKDWERGGVAHNTKCLDCKIISRPNYISVIHEEKE